MGREGRSEIIDKTRMDDEMACSRCRSSKLQKPSLKLFINNCGHSICDNCLDILYPANKGTNNCTTCSVPLRRSDFRVQLFQDCFVEKDVDIRRKILKDFNKKQDDFESLDEYNDYLEDVEDIIHNLANNVDVEATKRKVEKYKKDNNQIIMKNRGKLDKDQELIEMLIHHDKEREEWRKQIISRESRDISKTKAVEKEALVDELMFSDLPANQILAAHERNKKSMMESQKELQTLPKPPKHSYFSTGIKAGTKSNLFLPLPEEDTQYVYKKIIMDTQGPKCPEFSQLKPSGYLRNIRTLEICEKAGGFLPQYPCLRALEEAFDGLYVHPPL